VKPPKVVLDTNVVLSALLFTGGRLAAVRQTWHASRCKPLIATATATELIQALAYPKFKLSDEDRHQLLADYLPYCTTIRMPSKLPKTPRCRDPFDVPFLQLALVGKADYLVTGDNDLLALSKTFSRSIITADRFLTLLET
jgi:putative PIN family toxin of toxin-antitoxin system